MFISESLNAIIQAAKDGNVEKIREIFSAQKGTIDLNTPEEGGTLPLFYAADKGHFDVVKTLIELGASPALLDKNGATALHRAAQNGHYSIVEYLLSCDSTLLNVRDASGKAAVDYAAENHNSLRQESIFVFLIMRGANLAHFDKTRLLIEFAKFPWSTKVLSVLLYQGADINGYVQGKKYNVLMMACGFGCEENVNLLLNRGADLTLKNKTYETAATIANLKGFFRITHQLMQVLYLDTQKHGIILSPPPVIYTPDNTKCGFFAAACATNYLFTKYKNHFTQSLYPPTKDYKNMGNYLVNNDESLYSKRKSLGIKGIGEIFAHTDLRKLIALNQCKTEIVDVFNYKDFINIICHALCAGLPVIVPYANEVDKDEVKKTYSATAAHWATIIGYAKKNAVEYFILADKGVYTSFIARELFDRFFYIEATFNALEFCKVDYKILYDKFPDNLYFARRNSLKRDWVVKTKELANLGQQIFEELAIKEYIAPKTKLTVDFRRKVTLVYPPVLKKSLELVENESILMEKTSNKKISP